MKYKLRRIISFFCAVLVLFAFLTSKPQTAKAEPITVATAVIWSVASLLSSLGVGMAIDEDFRNDVITGVKNIPQWGAENLAKIQTAYMGAAGLAVATIGGRDYIQLNAEDLSLAASMLNNNLPNNITVQKSNLPSVNEYVSYHTMYHYHESWNETIKGEMYEYDIDVIKSDDDPTEENIMDTALFIFVPLENLRTNNRPSSTYLSRVFFCEEDTEAYEYLKSMNADLSEYKAKLYAGMLYWSGDNQSKVYEDYMPYSISSITLGAYNNIVAGMITKNGVDGINFFEEQFRVIGVGKSYVPASVYGFGLTKDVSMSSTKSIYKELSKLLDQLIKDNPSLADDVISVPVDDDTIGNDLPGLLAMLKQLDVNSAQGVQDLITAIERALAKADAEAIATAGTLTGIAQGVTTMTGDIADVKEKVKELTDAMAEEVELDMDKMKITTSLATRFPFCIPFDLASAFSSLGGLPRTAPSWTLPWTVDGTTASIELDLAEFEEWAKVIRWGTLITFNIGLILVTRKLIKG